MNPSVPAMPDFSFASAALGQLMPMFLWLDSDGHIRGAGPTLLKLMGTGALGTRFDEVFALRSPRNAVSVAALTTAPRLKMHLRAPPGTGFKGVAVPLNGSADILLNLSFGYAVREAVRDHALSDTDFAPTDLAIELLYLAEARGAVMSEVSRMNDRLRQAKQRAEEQALTDVLTGLHNRRAMERQLTHLIAANAPFAMVHLDLDYFKEVNDTLGHAAGDHVLCEVATILRGAVREADMVARVGGDEFIVLMPEINDFAPIIAIGRRILERLEKPIPFQNHESRVAASLGAVLSRSYHRPMASRLLSDVDRALYGSKRAGRNGLTLMEADGSTRLVRASGVTENASHIAPSGGVQAHQLPSIEQKTS